MRAFGTPQHDQQRGPHRLGVAIWGIWAAICLLSADLAVAEGPKSDDIVLASRIFDIPFRMDGGTQATAVRLYVSADQGKSWKIADHQPLPLEKFHFEADEDGEYWFAHATNLHTIVDPARQLRPERRIIIDTRGPFIQLEGNADLDGKLTAKLMMTDERPVKTLRVLYATDVERTWKAVDNDSIDSSGTFSVEPSVDWRQMSVHVTASDSLDNVSVQAKTFRRPRFASTPGPPNGKGEAQIRTAAGPSDPPSFLLGPRVGDPNAPVTPSASQPTYPAPSAGYAPGSSPINSPRTGAPTVASPVPQGALSYDQPGSPPANRYSPAPSAGMPLRGMTSAPASRAPAPAPAAANGFAAPSNTGTPSARSMPGPSIAQSLPLSGVEARLTTGGIETIAPQNPTPDPSVHGGPAAAPNQLFAPANQLNAPAIPGSTNAASPAPSTVPRNPGDPITEAIPTPTPTATDVEAPAQPARPRTLRDAMRPMSANPPQAGAPEAIATPPGSSDLTERYRVERAEQATRDSQLRYDLASLGNSAVIRYSDSNRFSLDYELEAVGSTGVESVELYGSTDGGRQWKRWGADPDRQSPFDIETKGEGLFSFRIVVMGNNGLTTPRPLPGDSPDIVVVVDQQLPQIRITSARYGEGDRTGSLVIRYECADDNLMSRPIAIAFSDSMQGPWTTIAAGLRNDGLYVWPADPKLPPKIYLRIDATDQAGNTGRYLLDQPIATMGLAPRAKILGFRSR